MDAAGRQNPIFQEQLMSPRSPRSRKLVTSLLVLASLSALRAPAQILTIDANNHQYFNTGGTGGATIPLIGVSGDYLPHVAQTQFPCGLANYQATCIDQLAAQGVNKIRMWLSLNQSAGVIFTGTPYPHEQPFLYKGLITPPHQTTPYPTWDLTQWDPTFFTNVYNVVNYAASKGVFVEVTLFDPWQGDDKGTGPWKHNIQNAAFTNTEYLVSYDNGTADVACTTAPCNQAMRQYQDNFVKQIAQTLQPLNNFYWEIANEPDIDGQVDITGETNWHEHIASVIFNYENPLGRNHLIAANYTIRGSINAAAVSSRISIINSHYVKLTGATGPGGSIPESARFSALKMIRNYNGGSSPTQADKVFGFNEDRPTGPVGNNQTIDGARAAAWEFALNEGGEIDHLRYDTGTDYSTLLVQYGFLKKFLRTTPLKFMKRLAVPSWIASLPAYPTTNALSKYWAAMEDDGNTYVIYFHNSSLSGAEFDKYLPSSGSYTESLQLQNLGATACYQYTWYDPKAANAISSGTFPWSGTPVTLNSPTYVYDIVLKLNPCP
jgi:hypothetical protein